VHGWKLFQFAQSSNNVKGGKSLEHLDKWFKLGS
jgi:hypothetical protein